jgi:hypothetical protein
MFSIVLHRQIGMLIASVGLLIYALTSFRSPATILRWQGHWDRSFLPPYPNALSPEMLDLMEKNPEEHKKLFPGLIAEINLFGLVSLIFSLGLLVGFILTLS